jgi:hypothetical protein
MAIEFICPTCQKVLKLRDEAAGKTGKCPFCKSVITVPASALADDDMIEIVPANAPKKPVIAPPKPPRAVPPPVPSVTAPKPPAQPVGLQPGMKPCPGCGKELPEKVVICVGCGFNLKTGKKLQTVFEAPEPAPEKPAEPSKPKEPEPPKA